MFFYQDRRPGGGGEGGVYGTKGGYEVSEVEAGVGILLG